MSENEIWEQARREPDSFLNEEIAPHYSEKEILAAAAQNDTPEGFAAFFLLMQGFPLHDEGIKWVANAYKAHEQDLALAQRAFRGSGKTTVFSKNLFAFRIGHQPNTSNIIIRINGGKARETVSLVSDIIEHSEDWKLVFPHVAPDKDKGWSSHGYYVKRTDVPYEDWISERTKGTQDPTFVGYGWDSGSVIGSRCSGILIVDDIHDRDNTASDRQMQAVKDFVTETLEYVKVPGAWEVWNYTPWRTNDTYAYIEGTGEYLLSESPGLRLDPEGELWPIDPKIPFSNKKWKLSWKDMYGFHEFSKRYRKTGHIAFSRMILLDLKATEGQTLKREWLAEFPAEEIRASWPVVFGIDYTSTADKLKAGKNDYFAMSIMRIMPGGGLVLFDGLRAHLTKGEALQEVAKYSAMYPNLHAIGVETHGTGNEFYQDLMTLRDMAGRPLPLRSINHNKKGGQSTNSKGWRFEEWLGPQFQFNRIWITDTFTPFMHSFLNEWLSYPSTEHDDCLDSVYMGAKAVETKLSGPRIATGAQVNEMWPYNDANPEPHPYAGLGSYDNEG